MLPSRYEDRTQISEIGSVRPGMRAVVEGEIQLTEVAYRRRRQLLCRITDGTGSLTLRFFYFSGAQQAESGARHAHSLLRRSAARSAGPGDRASRISPHRRRKPRRSRKS